MLVAIGLGWRCQTTSPKQWTRPAFSHWFEPALSTDTVWLYSYGARLDEDTLAYKVLTEAHWDTLQHYAVEGLDLSPIFWARPYNADTLSFHPVYATARWPIDPEYDAYLLQTVDQVHHFPVYALVYHKKQQQIVAYEKVAATNQPGVFSGSYALFSYWVRTKKRVQWWRKEEQAYHYLDLREAPDGTLFDSFISGDTIRQWGCQWEAGQFEPILKTHYWQQLVDERTTAGKDTMVQYKTSGLWFNPDFFKDSAQAQQQFEERWKGLDAWRQSQ